jgi:hypothetical protein
VTILIQIYYMTINSKTRMLRQGEFPLKGRSKEQAAFDFWQWIKKEMPVEITIDKVLVEDEDITEKIKEMEKGAK